MCGKCNPITSDFNARGEMACGGKRPEWRILERVSEDLYILSWPQDSGVRYAPLYIHSFPLCAPRKILEATSLNRQYHRYEDIQSVPDRLRWLRHSRGLMQTEVAERIGMSNYTYKTIEEGTAQHFDKEMRDALARFFGVPAADFTDEFNQFLEDGQGGRIRAWRSRTGLSRQAFADRYGIPFRSLEVWEIEKKAISYKSWEKYFKGRA